MHRAQDAAIKVDSPTVMQAAAKDAGAGFDDAEELRRQEEAQEDVRWRRAWLVKGHWFTTGECGEVMI